MAVSLRPVLASRLAPLVASALVGLTPVVAQAFCGFYVAGADAKLSNDATMVALMRNDTRTVRRSASCGM